MSFYLLSVSELFLFVVHPNLLRLLPNEEF